MPRKQSKPTPRKVVNTEVSGRLLAVNMMEQMETYEVFITQTDRPWPWSIRAMFRVKDTQQDNVLLRYLEAMRDKPRALIGFTSVLTDYLGQALCESSGGTPFLHYYTKEVTPRDLTDHPGPWPTMEEERHV